VSHTRFVEEGEADRRLATLTWLDDLETVIEETGKAAAEAAAAYARHGPDPSAARAIRNLVAAIGFLAGGLGVIADKLAAEP